MTSKVASSCEPRTVHPWGKPSQEKNPRRPERCYVEEAEASFYCLQASSVPFRPSDLCLVVSSSETNRQGPVVFRAAAGAAERKRSSGQCTTAEVGHAALELRERAAGRVGPVRRGRGHKRAQKVEQLTAAGVVRADRAAEVGRGSVKLQMRVRAHRP